MSIMFALSLALAASNVGQNSNTAQPTALVELAPLRGLLGQLAIRAELPFSERFALAAAYEQYSTASERADFHDLHAVAGGELAVYPLGYKSFPMFIATGLRQETAQTGRQRVRDNNSWARTNGNDLYDRWTNHDTYWSSTQSLGYRCLFSGFATASLRLMREELVQRSSSIGRDDVKSFDPDLSGKGRKRVAMSLSVHLGVYLP